MRTVTATAILLGVCLLAPRDVAAQTPPVIKGPPAPVAPDVITRDAEGRATVRAIRLTAPIRFDGRLDEEFYTVTPPITGFFQTVPNPGEAASEKTDVWVTFDDRNIYVSARCWDSAGKAGWIANEMRRDRFRENDNFGVLFDTYYDRQSGYAFWTNQLGAIGDFQVSTEATSNSDFNPIWDVRTGEFEGGWSVEIMVPFRSIRYRQGLDQIWGVQFRRTIRRTNENSFLTKLPRVAGSGGMTRVSGAATLVGVQVPAGVKNLEIKPYGIASAVTEPLARPARRNDGDANAGIDVKYAVTQNLALDVTVNTDFAQVEVDDQQVNLTRFNLLYPEKREFYLEGAGNFGFGGGQAPTIFFSRQIGLNRGRVIPTRAGVRLTGKQGRTAIGALNVTTGDETVSGTPGTNFTAVRVRRDLLRRSNVGGIFTNRSQSNAAPGGSSQAYGADANFALFDNLDVNGLYARTTTTGQPDRESYQARFDYSLDQYGFGVEHTFVDRAFNPEVGFVRRDDMRRTYGFGRVSPRFTDRPRLRRLIFQGTAEDILNAAGVRTSQEFSGSFETEFTSTDRISVSLSRNYDRLDAPFRLSPQVAIPVGAYTFTNFRAAYTLGPQKRIAGAIAYEGGRYYDGTQSILSLSSGRLALTPRLAIEPSGALNWISTPRGQFNSTVVRARMTYTCKPRMFVAGLLQYNSTSDTYSANVRFRWEYKLGSELFVVFNEDRDTNTGHTGWTRLLNRAFVVKVNRLMRF